MTIDYHGSGHMDILSITGFAGEMMTIAIYDILYIYNIPCFVRLTELRITAGDSVCKKAPDASLGIIHDTSSMEKKN
ncbi:MAG: hypothetical protein IJY93_04280 [Clostridia bacterium]|nr:hypothetical protein [Clostridia bacterium]